MAEIAFRVGPAVKWISGINEQTTCKDILVSLLRTSSLLPAVEQEEMVHHNYALVERWREVSKVLPPTSLILKIWTAWGEEQDCVSFTVKRVKRGPEREEEEEAGGRRRVRRRSSKAGDTLHPRALVRGSREKELHLQMKKIISQGERIRRTLATLKAEEGGQGEKETATPSSLLPPALSLSPAPCPLLPLATPCPLPPASGQCSEVTGTDSGNVTEGSETSSAEPGLEEEEVEEEGAEEEVTKTLQDCQKEEEKQEDEEEESSDIHGLIEMLEKLHRINKVLESKEEQILTMKFECDVLTGAPLEAAEAPNPTFDREVVDYREVNAAQLRKIADNSTVLRGLKEESEERRREMARLEFDVNLIERESKRLQTDLRKVESIGCDGLAVGDSSAGTEQQQIYNISQGDQQLYGRSNGRQSIYGTRVPGPELTASSNQNEEDVYNNRETVLAGQSVYSRLLPPPPSPPSASPPSEDRSSPPGSSRGSDKSVRFNDQEDVLRFCSSASSASLSPPPLLLPILSPRSILKCVKGGYGSDSGSDTGVSSLSSMQGDYELSTLV